MKYCPSPDCPYALRHREAQEYRDEIALCSDCGASLVLERPAWPASSPSPGVWPVRQIAVTLLALPLPGLLTHFATLPGHQGSVAPRIDDPTGPLGPVSVFSLGLSPVITAFLLVEIAALAVPGWRRLRHGGPEARASLRTASLQLALGLATVQALAMVLVLQRQDLLPSGQDFRRLLAVFSLLGGTCAFVVLAQLLDRFALGGGFSLVIVATLLPALGPFVEETKGLALSHPPALVGTLTALALAALATLLVLRRPWDRETSSVVRGPACGILPLRQGASLLTLAGLLASLELWPEALNPARLDPLPWWALYFSLTALLAILWGVLFNPPLRVAEHEVRAPDHLSVDRFRRARNRVQEALLLGLAYVLGLALLSLLLDLTFGVQGPDVVLVAVLVAFGLDAGAEANALRRHPHLVAVWPEHRLYAVDGALAMLEQAGIPCFARSVHHRALWHFFAPVIPIQLLVVADRAEEARRLLHQHFLARPT